jgi:hypothetical protein
MDMILYALSFAAYILAGFEVNAGYVGVAVAMFGIGTLIALSGIGTYLARVIRAK